MRRPLVFLAAMQVLFLLLLRGAGVESRTERSLLILEDVREGDELVLSGTVLDREVFDESVRLTLGRLSWVPAGAAASGTEPSGDSDTAGAESSAESSAKASAEAFSGSSASLRVKLYGKVQLWPDDQDRQKIFPGDICVVSGKRKEYAAATNPGEFDRRAWRQENGFLFELKEPVLQEVCRSDYVTYAGYRLRTAIQKLLKGILPTGDDAAAASAVFLGEKSDLPEELRALYQNAGISHILAISGLHTGILAMGVWKLLRRRRLPFFLCGMTACSLLGGYLWLTGFAVSARRAFVMFLIWCGAEAAGRGADALTTLACAVIVITAGDPLALTQSSFLLSFGCIASLILIAPALRRTGKKLRIKGRGGAWRRMRFFRCLLPGTAIFLGTAPLLCRFFYQITPWSLFLNLLVIPMMPVLLVCLLAGIFSGAFFVPAGQFAAAPVHYLLALIRMLCLLERRLPGCVLTTGCPAWPRIFLYYLLLCLALWPVKRMIRGGRCRVWCGRLRLPLLLLAAWMILLCRSRPALRITFLDVGQGDGILVESDDFTALIDCGSSSVDQVWERRVKQTLLYRGIRTLDMIFISHGDMDHVGGVLEFVKPYETDAAGLGCGGISAGCLCVSCYAGEDPAQEELMELCQDKGIDVQILERGDCVRAGSLSVTCLYPDSGLPGGEGNENSMVLSVCRGDFTALFTGDLEGAGEEQFLKYCLPGETVDVLKVAHHGSRYSTPEAFLERIRPDVSVISCGRGNSYGHPHRELIRRLENAGTKILRTDQCGAITVTCRKDGNYGAQMERCTGFE